MATQALATPEVIIAGAVVGLLGGVTYTMKKLADKGVVMKCKVGICPNSCLECSCDSNEVNDPDFFKDPTEGDPPSDRGPISAQV